MAFGTGLLNDPQKVQGGERFGTTNIILSETAFEDGLKVGRFAKFDTLSMDNMDGSATPVIGGLILRNVASPVEDADAIDSALFSQISYGRSGLYSVDVRTGETPVKFGAVFASNAGDANDGKASTTVGATPDIATGAEFLEEIAGGTNPVWLIRMK
jgi:hypothetical protein